MSEIYDVGGDDFLDPATFSETYSDPISDFTHDTTEFASDDDPASADTREHFEAGIEKAEPATDSGVESLPTELRFGASIGPYGETADSYAEEYNYSTTTDTYTGAQSGREIDPWTGTEKK